MAIRKRLNTSTIRPAGPENENSGAYSPLQIAGAGGGIRTRTSSRTEDFKSPASAFPPLPRQPCCHMSYHREYNTIAHLALSAACCKGLPGRPGFSTRPLCMAIARNRPGRHASGQRVRRSRQHVTPGCRFRPAPVRYKQPCRPVFQQHSP